MSWSWTYDSTDSSEPSEGAPPQPESFSSQSDAESWVGEVWRDLAEAGVRAVTLTRDGATVYTMSLEEG